MPHLIATLCAIAESELWTISEFRGWADSLISVAERPAVWLINLSMSKSLDDVENLLSSGLMSYGQTLPENYGELLLSFLCLRYRKNAIGRRDLLSKLFDVCDAYETGVFNMSELAELASRSDPERSVAWPALEARLLQFGEAAEAMEADLKDEHLPEREAEILES